MSSPQKKLAERIRELRRRQFGPRGKERFARLVGVSPRAYERFEHGTVPAGDVLVRMCQVTGEDLQWLLTGVSARGTLVISGARDRHQEVLGRLARLLEHSPDAAGPVEAFLDLLSQGREARQQARARLPEVGGGRLIPVYEWDEISARMTMPPVGGSSDVSGDDAALSARQPRAAPLPSRAFARRSQPSTKPVDDSPGTPPDGPRGASADQWPPAGRGGALQESASPTGPGEATWLAESALNADVLRTRRAFASEPTVRDAAVGAALALVTLATGDGPREFVDVGALANVPAEAMAIRIGDDALTPLLRRDDVAIIARVPVPRPGRPVVCRIAERDAPDCRIWLGESRGKTFLGRLGDGAEETTRASSIVWRMEVLYRIRPAA